jgi:hypothetical protein
MLLCGNSEAAAHCLGALRHAATGIGVVRDLTKPRDVASMRRERVGPRINPLDGPATAARLGANRGRTAGHRARLRRRGRYRRLTDDVGLRVHRLPARLFDARWRGVDPAAQQATLAFELRALAFQLRFAFAQSLPLELGAVVAALARNGLRPRFAATGLPLAQLPLSFEVCFALSLAMLPLAFQARFVLARASDLRALVRARARRRLVMTRPLRFAMLLRRMCLRFGWRTAAGRTARIDLVAEAGRLRLGRQCQRESQASGGAKAHRR